MARRTHRFTPRRWSERAVREDQKDNGGSYYIGAQYGLQQDTSNFHINYLQEVSVTLTEFHRMW